MKDFFEKVYLKKKTADDNKSMKRVNIITEIVLITLTNTTASDKSKSTLILYTKYGRGLNKG